MKVSYSALEVYNTCPKKYFYKYIEKLEPDNTYSALLFGKSIDEALNYILIKKKNKETIGQNELLIADGIFLNNMNKWNGQNQLVYFKSDLPFWNGSENFNAEELQNLVWLNLREIGFKMLDTYITEILPLFEEIVDVQIEQKIVNEDDDVLKIVIDFIGKLKTGETVVFDNKTASASSFKSTYTKNAVKNSTQLSIYSEFYDYKAGYIALEKKIVDNKIQWKMIVDEISDEKRESVFQKIAKTTGDIKAGIFEKNEKSCFSFGRLCEYNGICKFGNRNGLVERK